MNSKIPYVGIIRFNIFIHKMNPDGSIDPEVVDCSEQFSNTNIANKAELKITTIGLENCIQEIKNKMEKLT